MKLGEISGVELVSTCEAYATTPLDFLWHNILINSAGHSITDVQVRGMRLCRGSNILRKQLEMRLIFQLGTVQPDGLIRLNCARATFYAYAFPFNVVTNTLRISTVIFHTEEGLYTRNVCVNRHF